MFIRSILRRLLGGLASSQQLAVAQGGDSTEPVIAGGVEEAPVKRGFLAICAIMKNESTGILEWIAYHRAIGVEHFFLYDNGSEDDTVAKVMPLQDAGIITVIDWPRKPGQIEAYNDFVEHHRDEWEWCAFIDLDEYINPFGFGSIPEWLHRFDDRAGVAIQWINFGRAGLEEPPEGLAIEAYNLRLEDLHGMHGHVKTIMRVAKYDRAIGPHSFFATEGEIVDERDEPVARNGIDYAIQQPMLHDGVCINHYYTRSRKEWWIKINRGLADAGEVALNPRNPDWLDIYDREAIVPDARIMKFAAQTATVLEEFAALGARNLPQG